MGCALKLESGFCCLGGEMILRGGEGDELEDNFCFGCCVDENDDDNDGDEDDESDLRVVLIGRLSIDSLLFVAVPNCKS